MGLSENSQPMQSKYAAAKLIGVMAERVKDKINGLIFPLRDESLAEFLNSTLVSFLGLFFLIELLFFCNDALFSTFIGSFSIEYEKFLIFRLLLSKGLRLLLLDMRRIKTESISSNSSIRDESDLDNFMM